MKKEKLYGTEGIYKEIEVNIESGKSVYESTPITTERAFFKSVLNTLSLRRKSKKKAIVETIPNELGEKIESSLSQIGNDHHQLIYTDSIDDDQEPIYEVIKENPSNVNGSNQKIIRDKILTPEEELLFSLINTVNKHSGLREILSSIRYRSNLYDQIRLMQQFSKGSDIACTFSDYMEIVKKVDLSLNKIIENQTGDNKAALKDLALSNSLYLFAHDLWDVFMPMEGDYQTIEGDYENMNRGEKIEPDYMDMSGVRKFGLFAVDKKGMKQNQEAHQQEEIYILPTILN